jgi:hypothetical protein
MSEKGGAAFAVTAPTAKADGLSLRLPEPPSQNGGTRLYHQSTGVLGVIGPLPYCDSCIIK